MNAMPRIALKPETLEEHIGHFDRAPITVPTFLNSVPKCGTHLIKNIVRAFVPLDQHYEDVFIQIPILQQHARAFNPNNPKLSWGHLLYSDHSGIALRDAYHLLMVRDPYDWVLARTRFFLSDNFRGNMENLKSGQLTIDEIMNLMIFGIHQKAPPMRDIFDLNACAWVGTRARILKFEELLHHVKNIDSDEAEPFFADLLSPMGLSELPADWRERIKIASDEKLSATHRDNLKDIALEVPRVLPDTQKAIVDYALPGLRAFLGYV